MSARLPRGPRDVDAGGTPRERQRRSRRALESSDVARDDLVGLYAALLEQMRAGRQRDLEIARLRDTYEGATGRPAADDVVELSRAELIRLHGGPEAVAAMKSWRADRERERRAERAQIVAELRVLSAVIAFLDSVVWHAAVQSHPGLRQVSGPVDKEDRAPAPERQRRDRSDERVRVESIPTPSPRVESARADGALRRLDPPDWSWVQTASAALDDDEIARALELAGDFVSGRRGRAIGKVRQLRKRARRDR